MRMGVHCIGNHTFEIGTTYIFDTKDCENLRQTEAWGHSWKIKERGKSLKQRRKQILEYLYDTKKS